MNGVDSSSIEKINQSGLLISISTEEARRRKWEEGRARHGSEFVGHPLLELDEELLDALNYCDEALRQGYDVEEIRCALFPLRDAVRSIYWGASRHGLHERPPTDKTDKTDKTPTGDRASSHEMNEINELGRIAEISPDGGSFVKSN